MAFDFPEREVIVNLKRPGILHHIIVTLRLFMIFGITVSTLVTVQYLAVPHSNASMTSVDVLVILGCPTMPDGSFTAEQRERVNEGVREFHSGVSNHIIMTGGAAYNHFVEAHALATLARVSGVPFLAITEETRSTNTIENIYFANAIMKTNGWHTAEVISSPSHLARIALILEHYPGVRWKTHAARWPEGYTLSRRTQLYTLEAIKSFCMRLSGFWSFNYLP